MTASGAVAFLLALVVATASCGKRDGETQLTPKHDGKRSYEEFAKLVGKFPYTAPRERRDRVLAGYSQLELGATKDQVVNAIGEPDYSQSDYSKGAKPRWLGSSWVYYLSKRNDGANSFDPVVHVFFGTDDRAVWIVPSNIGGLQEKGSPSRSRT